MSARGRGQSKRPFYTVLALLALVGAGALGWVASRPKRASVAVDTSVPPGPAQGYLLGRPDAPVQVLEFADFECPACGNFAVVTEPDVRTRLIESGKMSLRFYDFPLSIHRNTWQAHHAAACANDQGKFWQMHDRIFAGQTDWNTQATSNPDRVFKRYAKELGLNADAFETCYDSRRHQATLAGNQREGERLKVNSTPSFVIGGRLYSGSMSFDEIKRVVDSVAALAPAPGAATAPTATPAARADSAPRPR
ncbi:MAG: DsbA family protein [Gemmatimonadaceae bacterium]